MSFISLVGLCLLFGSLTAAGLHSEDPSLMVALVGDTVTLPCAASSMKSCSYVKWNMDGKFGFVTEVMEAAAATGNSDRHKVMSDCTLRISHLLPDDARLYTCDTGTTNSSVSLRILELTEEAKPAQDTMELHCFLNTYSGYQECKNTRIHIKWTAEDDSPLNGNRFRFDKASDCFSKLIITKKTTDHHRTWKCHFTEDDEVKATTSFTTALKDGLEEVVAAVGESVQLICRNSSLNVGGSVNWTVCKPPLRSHTSPACSPVKELHEMKDSLSVISEVRAEHAGDYQCSESTGQQRVLNRIRLHTLDVTRESGPGGDNITLICVLTCAAQCEDFNLTWSGNTQKGPQSALMNINNTLVRKLYLSVESVRDEIICSMHREGALMAAKKWHAVNPLQTAAWLGLPLGLITCAAAGGIFMCMKNRHKKEAAAEQSSIGMTHVYDVIQDAQNEEQQQPQLFRRETANTKDGFYDLLQPVN